MKHIILLFLFLSLALQANESYKTINGKASKLKKATNYISIKTDIEMTRDMLKKELFLLNIPEILKIKKIDSKRFVIKFKSEIKNESIFNNYEILPSYIISDSNGWPLITDKKIIVKFKNNISKTVQNKIFKKYGLVKTHTFTHDKDTYELDTSNDSFEIANKLFNLGIFEYSYPNFYIRYIPQFRPNDTYFSKQWHLNSSTGGVYAREAWDINKGSSAIKIAIVDNGMDLNHEDLNIVGYYDFTTAPGGFNNAGEHGTACAGVAAGSGNNNQGITGLCMNCSILAVKMMPSEYAVSSASAKAINWSVTQGADVINNSWGNDTDYDVYRYNRTLYDAIHNAVTNGRGGKGSVVLFAAGNESRNFSNISMPGLTDVITVGAVNFQNKRSYYSNYGEHLHVVAPSNGYNNWGIITADITGSGGYNNDSTYHYNSTYNNNYTNNFGGTSSATPLVSGLVGLMLSENNDLTATEVKQILKDTAVKITVADEDVPTGGDFTCADKVGAAYSNGHSVCMGYGMINAKLTMQYVQNMNGCTPDVNGEICNNNIDDDCDNLIDSNDPDCIVTDPCAGVNCAAQFPHTVCGPYDNADGYGCFCENGYKVNTDRSACIPITCSDIECGTNAYCDETELACVCNDGYRFDSVTSTCISTDPCLDVSCENWEECNGVTGFCVLKADRCNRNTDCNNTNYVCNENHECIALNLCAGITCDNHGMCGMVNGTPTCTCDEDYFTSTDKKHCISPCTGITCSWNGSCTPINVTTAVCECYEGYHEDGLDCISNNPCDGVTCSYLGNCTISNGNAKCNCNNGFHDVGLTCVENDIDPCDGITCGTHGYCVLNAGEATCNCDNGYHNENLICVDNNICGNDICKDWEKCDNSNCILKNNRCNGNNDCPGDTNLCNETHQCYSTSNICDGITCSDHGTCSVINEQPTCNCDNGYSVNNLTCVQDNLCATVTCSGKGTCEVINNNATCDCFRGYHAENLECIQDAINPCDGISCSNHGNCKEENNQATCECNNGYHAENLECILDVSTLCDDITCSNHGNCKIKNNQATCECNPGYTSSNLQCVKNTSVCAGIHCNLHGTCIVENNQAVCLCDAGYYEDGINCRLDERGYEGNAVCSYSNNNSNTPLILFSLLLIFVITIRRKKIK